MDTFRYLVRFLYRIRWFLVVLPMIALIVAWFATRNLDRVYDTNSTIYTGMITGYSIEGSGSGGSASQTNIRNLMLMITTETTIKEVSLRLFARCMMYGNPTKDNNYISAEHFRELYQTVPTDVKALINKNSESTTYANLKAYEKPSMSNYIFGLLNYHPYFSINSITSRLKVMQLNNSDIIDIGYSANDAGIAYNTLDILNDAFARQTQQIGHADEHGEDRQQHEVGQAGGGLGDSEIEIDHDAVPQEARRREGAEFTQEFTHGETSFLGAVGSGRGPARIE